MSVINIKLEPGRWFTWEDVKVSKFTSCDDCFYKHEKGLCDKCIHNLVDNFSCLPKKEWRTKLFVGAPIMVAEKGQNPSLSEWRGASYPPFFELRLPTVEEAPRNVWLCPWDEMPKELNSMEILIKSTLNDTLYQYIGCIKPLCINPNVWETAEAVMILDDFKR